MELEVDFETGGTRRPSWLYRVTSNLLVIAGALALLLVGAVIFWSWSPLAIVGRINELETRVERLERVHGINPKLEDLREEYRREQRELDELLGPEVPL